MGFYSNTNILQAVVAQAQRFYKKHLTPQRQVPPPPPTLFNYASQSPGPDHRV